MEVQYYRSCVVSYLIKECDFEYKLAEFVETASYNATNTWNKYIKLVMSYKAYNTINLFKNAPLEPFFNISFSKCNIVQENVIKMIYKFLIIANVDFEIITSAENILLYSYNIELYKFNYSKTFALTVNCIFNDIGWRDTFVNIYKDICAILLQGIDIHSECCKMYGKHNSLAALNGETFEFINTMQDLFPLAYQKEVDIINKKREQKIKIKVSNMFVCPQCKTNECEYTPAQRRGLDEPTGVDCSCLNCGYEFHIA